MDTSVVSCWLYVDVLGFESLAGWLARGAEYRIVRTIKKAGLLFDRDPRKCTARTR